MVERISPKNQSTVFFISSFSPRSLFVALSHHLILILLLMSGNFHLILDPTFSVFLSQAETEKLSFSDLNRQINLMLWLLKIGIFRMHFFSYLRLTPSFSFYSWSCSPCCISVSPGGSSPLTLCHFLQDFPPRIPPLFTTTHLTTHLPMQLFHLTFATNFYPFSACY